jgi:hypothetical protein
LIVTPLQWQTLHELEAAGRHFATARFRGGWARPLDCGPSGTHHARTLKTLARRGLAERRSFLPSERHVYEYRITAKGLQALQEATPPAWGPWG